MAVQHDNLDNSLLGTLKKIQSKTTKCGEIVCVLCLVGIVISTSLSVFFRYVFFFPLNFSDPLSVLLLSWMTFIGAGLAAASGEHVYIDFFLKRFSKTISKQLLILSAFLISFFLASISYYGYIFAWAMRDSSDPMVFGLSLLIPYMSVPVGATYTLLQIWLAAGIGWMEFGGTDSGAQAVVL